MFKKIIIGLILLVCICSSAFSVIYYYIPTNNSDIFNIDSNSIIGNTNEDIKSIENNPLTNYMDIDDTLQYSYGYVINVNGELRHYINNYGAYYLKSEELTDRYIVCVECGGFVPIGEITNPLPKTAICHHNTANVFTSNYKDFSYSRDEAYDMWIKEGNPVYDKVHLNNFSNYGGEYINTIHCNDCGGIVILKNYTESMIYYFNVADTDIDVLSIPNILCTHYNGSLDVFNTPAEDFHPGWFRSMDKYNEWLNIVSKSVNDNVTDDIHWDSNDDPVVVIIDEEDSNVSQDYMDEENTFIQDGDVQNPVQNSSIL